MSYRLQNLVRVVLAGALFLLGVGQAAAAAPGQDPNSALAPGGGWMPLAVGQQVWFAFQYAGDDSQILVDMRVSPSGGAALTVWTPADLASWAAGNPPNPIGHGSGDSYIGSGDVVWSGSFNEPGTYYVNVTQSGQAASGIQLNVIGSGVSVGTPAAAARAVPVNRPLNQTTPSPAPIVGGQDPNSALAPGGGWMPLAVGQQVWFAFQYAGDDSQILVDMAVKPSQGANFTVWTPADLASWAAGNPPNPIGHGSGDSYVGSADVVWSGSFNEPGTYYVNVTQAGQAASGIQLNVTGGGVSMRAIAGAQGGGR